MSLWSLALPRQKNGVPVAVRVGVLAAIAVVAVIALSLTHFLGDARNNAAVDRMQDNRRLETLAGQLANETLQMRRREKDFLIRRNQEEADRYEAAVKQALSIIPRMSELAAARPVATQIGLAQAGVTAHRDQFRRIVEAYRTMGFDEKSGLQGELRTAVHAVETRLKAANLDALTVRMLMMRRHEKDLMLRGDLKYVGEVDARRAEFDGLMQQTELDTGARAEISGLLDAYVSGFKAYAANQARIAEEVEALSRIYADLTPHVETIVSKAVDGLEAAEADLDRTRGTVATVFVIAASAMLLAALALAYLIGRGITRPVLGITGAMRALADGDTSVSVPDAAAHREIGAMARAVEVFRANAIRTRELEAEQAEQAERSEAEKRAMMARLAEEFDGSVGRIVQAISQASHQLDHASQVMASASQDVDARSASVAAASEQTASNVHTVAAATEEMSASIEEISAQVLRASNATQQASDNIVQTTDQMTALSGVADRIGEVVSMISDIAAQTNLLALNATIESARAGEAGRGFAVVAGEVKALASETSKATDGIARLVGEIQTETRTAVSAIDGIGKIISELNGTTAAIAAAMEEQGATTREVSRNVVEAAEGSRSVSQSIAGVSTASRESRSAADTVTEAAQGLSSQSAAMREEVERFLAHIRAA
ncbi:methyl-accepting chemotaxis protein [Stappia sp. MMSF_3263]|uniref:methyl-accepting chemotaxis protein n=1 Tax=Stappia sp. MMSF_3263 TaxID=3046693 RepID=UPI00273F7F19|nr:methyl-accepting chemotaxis protein [Stappia sp. MMSF_3263]